MTPSAAAILEGMPDARILHRVDRDETTWIMAGPVVLACYQAGDAGMRNVAVAVCRQLGFGGRAVAAVAGRGRFGQGDRAPAGGGPVHGVPPPGPGRRAGAAARRRAGR